MIRKRKLTKLATVGLAVASAALVLAACGSSSTRPGVVVDDPTTAGHTWSRSPAAR